MGMRVASLWFPTLPIDRALRIRPVDTAFALTTRENNTDRIYGLNRAAQKLGLAHGMGLSDARALYPDLETQPADITGDARFLRGLARWAGRYCPWVGLDGNNALTLNVTGSTHLFGDESAMLADMKSRLLKARLQARIGFADTVGAAWAMAHYGEGIVKPGAGRATIGRHPIAALRLSAKTCVGLQRLGVATIADLAALPRRTVTRRFGPEPLLRLDQAFGDQPEPISPLRAPPHYGARLTFPDPIGLVEDVMAGLLRVLKQVCAKLEDAQQGGRIFQLTLRRADQTSQQVELRLARPLRNPERIMALFQKEVAAVDAGFGIDQLRLQAILVEKLSLSQISSVSKGDSSGLDDLITRLGTRIGIENIIRFLPAESHIPERSFSVAPAAYSKAEGSWATPRPRPLRMFPPEPIVATGRQPPKTFRWRRLLLATAQATGPERITPEWWLPDENWRSGIRDYWRVDTQQGRRLWLFHTPENPNWYVQGEFA